MKYLLSFAIGAILGDIFFHLIPESYQSHLIELNESRVSAHQKVGLSIISGIFMFIIVEMLLESWSNNSIADSEGALGCQNITESAKLNGTKITCDSCEDSDNIPIFTGLDLNRNIATTKSKEEIFKDIPDNNNITGATNLNLDQTKLDRKIDTDKGVLLDGVPSCEQVPRKRKKAPIAQRSKQTSNDFTHDSNHSFVEPGAILSEAKLIDFSHSTNPVSIDSAGYLNLIANGFDNFTHGLAIGASFLIGSKVGFLTTFVIFIHEIPHEICDYAILVNSGFSRWDAVKAQSSVSLFGIIGTATALYVKSVETLNAKTVWILPFSAGGFLYIALVNLLPEILDKETDLRSTLGQVTCVILGVLLMAIVAVV